MYSAVHIFPAFQTCVKVAMFGFERLVPITPFVLKRRTDAYVGQLELYENLRRNFTQIFTRTSSKTESFVLVYDKILFMIYC